MLSDIAGVWPSGTKPRDDASMRSGIDRDLPMKPFLYLDNWHAPQPETRFDKMLEEAGFEVECVRTNDGEFPAGMDYCGVYVSPSFNGAYDDEAWIHRQHDVLRDLAGTGVPMMGLCFGCQILASALCGRDQVTIRAGRERGFGAIHLTTVAQTGDPLTAGLPAQIPVFHWHGDEVRRGHPDIVVLADSPDCENQIWRWRHGPVWGIQPHPELDRAQLLAWFESNREVFEAGGLGYDELVSQARDQVEAGRLIENFVGYVKDAHSVEGDLELAGG